MKHIHLVTGLLVLILFSCSMPYETDPDQTILSDAAVTLTKTPMPLVMPSRTVSSTSTTAPILHSPTTTPSPTEVVEAKGESTVLPLPTDDPFLTELRNKGYEIVFSTSHSGPENLVYSVYALKDTALEPEYGDETSSEICRLAFYRWDGSKNVLIANFGAATYPEASRFGGFPVTCALANWNNDSWFTDIWRASWPLDEIRETLNLDGYWSDVNQNGLPEVGIFYWYCPNACHGYEGAVHFYEIQDDDTVIHITSDLKGVLLPWNILHTKRPTTLKIFDPSLEYEPHNYINTWWYYAWDSMKYTDVTPEYAEELLRRIEQWGIHIQEQYGSPITFTRTDFLEILFQSEKAGIQDEALEIFLEVSNPDHWPGTKQVYVCWLQVIRNQAQSDYDENRHFTMPPTPLGLSVSEGFDMQTCQYND